MWVIPENNVEGRAFIIVVIVFLALASFFFSLRIWARGISPSSLDASDYTCFLGLVLDVGLTVILWGAFSHGWGQDIWKFTADDATFSAALFIAIDVIWNSAVTAVRVSIVLFYIRIFPISRYRKVCWVVIGLNMVSLVAVIFSTCLICAPIAYSYDRTIPGGHCGDLLAFERYTAIWNLLADATVVVLPMPVLWNLQMHIRKKVGLSIILGMGTIICILTVTRVVVSIYYEPNNNTKQNAIVALITGLEPIIGVINACLPFLPSILQHISHTQLYLIASQRFRSAKNGIASGDHGGGSSLNRGKPDPSSETQILPRVGKRNDAFKKLGDRDMEMNLLHQAYLGDELRRDYTISGESSGSAKEGSEEQIEQQPPQGWNKSLAGIHVRKDFSIDNETCV